MATPTTLGRAVPGAHLGRLAWKGVSRKLWLSWAMMRSTSAYGWASRAKPWCWPLWRCCPGERRHRTLDKASAGRQGEPGRGRPSRGSPSDRSAGGAHPVELLEGLAAALAVPLPPPACSAGSRPPACLLALGLSGEKIGWEKAVTIGALGAELLL